MLQSVSVVQKNDFKRRRAQATPTYIRRRQIPDTHSLQRAAASTVNYVVGRCWARAICNLTATADSVVAGVVVVTRLPP